MIENSTSIGQLFEQVPVVESEKWIEFVRAALAGASPSEIQLTVVTMTVPAKNRPSKRKPKARPRKKLKTS